MAESSEQQQQRFIIGYALASKKQQSFIQPSLINHAKERGIDLIKIETDNELLINLNGPFDCILHKVYSEDWKRQLTDFQSANPNVVIIDSPEATELLHSRISMFHAVSQALLKIHVTTSVGIAKQIVIYDANPSSSESLKFPVIWKPLVVTDPKSQKMLLASSHTVLINNLKPPVVLQEFVNHGGVVFKVYVAGKHVRYVRRKFSLPEDKVDQEDSTETEIMPPEWLISAISKGLRESLKLNLFSFSVIRDTTVQRVRYVVIDMSYFPDYSKLPHYESLLTDFFCDLVAAKKDKEELDAGVKNNSSFRRHPRKQKTPVRSPSS